MSPALPSSLESHSIKMLAVVEQWETKDIYVNNTRQYLLLMMVKLGLDAIVLYLCWRRLHTSFLSVCGLSIVLADVAMVWSVAMAWFLGPLTFPVSVCFLLAHFSAVYAALPLPMAGLGLLDYISEENWTCSHNPFCRSLRNVVLALLVWALAVVYSYGTVTGDLMEIEYLGGGKALVCEVQEASTATYFVVVLFIAVIVTLLPHWSRLLQWFKEANRLSAQREEPHRNQMSDLLFNGVPYTEAKNCEENTLVDTVQRRPSLWLSLTLGFGSTWMPYLFISVACLLLGFGVPAYIVVNLLWLECTNSLLVGVVFWVKSNMYGPYTHLPDDICLWQVYWHISRGTNPCEHRLPTNVFNPSKKNRNTLIHL
ncbi:putative G-protein coupled receptor 160 [Polymixia lowei]